MNESVEFKKELLDSFCQEVKARFPKKTFGYFFSPAVNQPPTDFIIFERDIRNDWKDLFEEYGNYYKRNEDAGFLATPEETYKVEKYIRNKGMYKVGVFHSHQRHPAIFSTVDADLHPEKNLWHLIISLRNLEIPQLKVFSLNNSNIRELSILQK